MPKNNEKLAELARKGAAIQSCGKMCSSCAFKLNSAANLEPHNVETAFETLQEYSFGTRSQFNCHKQTGGDAGRICTGFQYATNYLSRHEI